MRARRTCRPASHGYEPHRHVRRAGLARRRIGHGRHCVDRELNVADMRMREKLYAEFIGECARLLIDAFTHTLEDPERVMPLYALTNRIRLTASEPVLAEAECLLKRITEQYFSSNLTVEDMRSLAGSDAADPLRPFGEACRIELKSIRARL
jgi:hypothetical protein